MEMHEALSAVEAILFASGEPVERSRIASVLGLSEPQITELMQTLKKQYEERNAGILLIQMEDSYQLCTRPEHAEPIRQVLDQRRNTPLSSAAMEVLAIIAYNQPVTKSFVEQVRGVDSSQTVNLLAEKGLIEEAGRLDLPGRPIAYRTAVGFLRSFGLESLKDLPPLPDDSDQLTLEEITSEA